MFSKDLKQFLDEHYKPAQALALPTKEVRDAYKRWAQEHNKSKFNYTSFNNVVEKEYNIINGFIHGITLKTTPLEPQLINAPAVASSNNREEINTLIKDGIKKMIDQYNNIDQARNAVVKGYLLARLQFYKSCINTIKDDSTSASAFLTLKYQFIVEHLEREIYQITQQEPESD